MDHHSHPSLSHGGTRRQKESGLTSRDLEKDSGNGAKGEQIKNLGRGSISCRGQDSSLETESIQPNSPPGEWLNNDYVSTVTCMSRHVIHFMSCQTSCPVMSCYLKMALQSHYLKMNDPLSSNSFLSVLNRDITLFMNL